MFCINCGHQISEEFKYCPECGKNREVKEESEREIIEDIMNELSSKKLVK